MKRCGIAVVMLAALAAISTAARHQTGFEVAYDLISLLRLRRTQPWGGNPRVG